MGQDVFELGYHIIKNRKPQLEAILSQGLTLFFFLLQIQTHKCQQWSSQMNAHLHYAMTDGSIRLTAD